MPQYNGAVSYFVHVVEHLLRHYVTWMFVYAVVLPAPFAIWGLIQLGFPDGVMPWLNLSLGTPVWWFGVSHLLAFVSLPYFVRVRFPYPPPFLTLATSAFVGAAMVGAVLMKVGGTGLLHWGLGRWVGWFVAGRDAFRAFLVADAERLKREYDAYAKFVRK